MAETEGFENPFPGESRGSEGLVNQGVTRFCSPLLPLDSPDSAVDSAVDLYRGHLAKLGPMHALVPDGIAENQAAPSVEGYRRLG